MIQGTCTELALTTNLPCHCLHSTAAQPPIWMSGCTSIWLSGYMAVWLSALLLSLLPFGHVGTVDTGCCHLEEHEIGVVGWNEVILVRHTVKVRWRVWPSLKV